ncbi:FAD-binding oxidoreductase [Paracoccus suum]|uniref:FAD-binding oxidoreductase n=1 Tax=Paracoccus suum TaxID=2259340 RepID=A0A344PHT2_9RHOB|nr:FAD-binding oxidoreductase [Paracoccus suum]AXC48937.1 FAD-binding oxidoreductase [Paracoccus suum]
MDRDIIVIGGGMAGISLAARLAETARVTVLETESRPGHHSTGRSAAIFILNYGGAVLRRLNQASQPFLLDPAEISETSLLTPRGELLVCGPGEGAAFAAYLDGAADMERISVADAVGMVPILRPERIEDAAYEPAAQDIDVDRMLQGFLRLLRRRGGELAVGAGVTGMSRENGVWKVTTMAGEWRAPIVVNAAGGWAETVAVMAGAKPRGLRPLRRSAALIPAPAGHDVSRWPMVANAGESWYAKPDAGKLMISPADEDPVEPHDVWAEEMVLAEGLARFEEAVTIEVTRVEHTWAGMRTFAPDRTPVIGFDGELDGFFWLAGQGGYGIQTAPAVSALAEDLILGRKSELTENLAESVSPLRAGLHPH